MTKQDLDGRFGYIPTWRHATIDYLQAAIPHGFVVGECHEPRRLRPIVDASTPEPSPPRQPDEPPDIWDLHPLAAEAANAVYRDEPCLVVWDFQLEVGGSRSGEVGRPAR